MTHPTRAGDGVGRWDTFEQQAGAVLSAVAGRPGHWAMLHTAGGRLLLAGTLTEAEKQDPARTEELFRANRGRRKNVTSRFNTVKYPVHTFRG